MAAPGLTIPVSGVRFPLHPPPNNGSPFRENFCFEYKKELPKGSSEIRSRCLPTDWTYHEVTIADIFSFVKNILSQHKFTCGGENVIVVF